MDTKDNSPQTERQNPNSMGFDSLTAMDAVKLMHSADAEALSAITPALPHIAKAAETATEAIRRGGKVVYAGAGTSGRLAVLDAAEVLPTFGSSNFTAIIAGGRQAVTEAVEGAEDDAQAGEREAMACVSEGDMALGVTASGRTPFVLGFLKGARAKGASCWLLRCSDNDVPPIILDGIITLPTGAEIIAGSTRLKAGTATKMALNMISTVAMTSLGGTHDGLMVDVMPTNEKLIERATGIVMQITGADRDRAAQALRDADMKPKTAALMLMRGISKNDANKVLSNSDGSLRRALEG